MAYPLVKLGHLSVYVGRELICTRIYVRIHVALGHVCFVFAQFAYFGIYKFGGVITVEPYGHATLRRVFYYFPHLR